MNIENVTNALPSQDSATGRSLKSGVYATASALVVFGTGVLHVINGVPGCSEALINYIQANALQLALMIGVPAGLFSFVVNYFRKGVKNYN